MLVLKACCFIDVVAAAVDVGFGSVVTIDVVISILLW